jgi:hypothetical protein
MKNTPSLLYLTRITLAVVFLCLSSTLPQAVLAQSPAAIDTKIPARAQQELTQARNSTPAAAASASASPDVVNEELSKRIKKKLEEKRDQVKGVLDSLLSDKRAMIGEVSRITDDAITIQHQTGTTIIPLSKQVTLLKNNKTIAIDEIAVGNWATVLGHRERNTIEPEFVLISTESLLPKQQIVLLGSITKESKNSLTIQPRGDEAEKTVSLTRSTVVQSANGEAATAANLSTEITVLISGYISENGIEARTIRSLAELK